MGTLEFVEMLGAAVVVSVIALGVAWQKLRQSVGTRYVIALSLASIIWCVGYGFELAGQGRLGEPWGFFWHVVCWLGIAPLGVLWFLFARSLGGARHSHRREYLFFILPCLTLVMIVLDPWFHMMYSASDEGFWARGQDYGAFFWLHTAYSYGLYLTGLIIIIVRTFQARYAFRTQLALIAIASVLSTCVNFWYVFFSDFPLDPSAISFAFMFSIVMVVLLQDRIFDIVPVARGLVVDTISFGIVMLNEKAEIVDANWVFCRMVGSSLAEIRGKASDDVFIGDLHNLCQAVQNEPPEMTAAHHKQTRRFLIKLSHQRTFKVYSTPIVEKNRSILRAFHIHQSKDDKSKDIPLQWYGQVLLLEDVSNQVAQDKALRDAKERAELANDAKNNFLATMGHELRTPLTVIRGYSEVLTTLDEPLDPNIVQDCANYIYRANQRLSHMVEDILRYSALEANTVDLDLQEIDMVALSKYVHDDVLEQGNEQGNTIQLYLPDTLTVLSDYQKMHYIVHQLVANAHKFTHKGHISMTVAKACRWQSTDMQDTDTRSEQRSNEELIEYECVVEVRDTGIGIREDKQEYIFSAFAQADESATRAYGGGGLGLALSQRYAEMLEAKLELESIPQQGSCFRLHVPMMMQKDKLAASWRQQLTEIL